MQKAPQRARRSTSGFLSGVGEWAGHMKPSPSDEVLENLLDPLANVEIAVLSLNSEDPPAVLVET